MNSIPLVLAFTSNYFVPACTTIQSILENTSEDQNYDIYCLLTDNLLLEQEQALKDWEPKRLKFVFINLSGQLDGIYVDERYTIAASFRLLLPDILSDIDKIIYLDCDFIVRNDLAKLYHTTDLSTYYLGVVYESPLDFQQEYVLQLGCKSGYYFNSGFLLMNLKLMRDNNLVKKFIQTSKRPYLQFPDQDVLNIVCADKVFALKPFWNGIRTFFIPEYKTEFLSKYNENDWEEVNKRGNIHYTGSKPWNEYTIRFDEWWKYYFSLPKSITKNWKIDKKLFLLGKLSNTKFGRFALNIMQKINRLIKTKNDK